jgi:selenocysteine lyase/cysteine desulfurase
MTITLEPDVRSLFVGVDEPVPTVEGDSIRYVNLDNAASTPVHVSVLAAIERFLPYYSSVHRGTGYKSRLSTQVYEQAREIVGNFVGADPSRDVVVFASNTTEAINKLARTMPIADGEVVVTTLLEHHSNDLPWRARGRTVRVRALADGSLDEDDLDRRLAEHAGRVALLAVSGASNVTGVMPPIHRLAEKVHAGGGRILVDAAQLAPHRPIDMRPHDDPGHLDFVALSAHKMYAPFGSGALIGPRAGFGSIPDHRGGGTVTTVTADDVTWADLPDRAEAGSPNVIGAVALAAAVEALQAIGWDRIVAHETALLRYTSARLAELPGVRLYGPSAADSPRVGVVPFNLDGSITAWSRRSSATSTVSASATGASAPIPTSSTCSASTPSLPERGRDASATATSGGFRAWCASALGATTARPTSTALSLASNTSPLATSRAVTTATHTESTDRSTTANQRCSPSPVGDQQHVTRGESDLRSRTTRWPTPADPGRELERPATRSMASRSCRSSPRSAICQPSEMSPSEPRHSSYAAPAAREPRCHQYRRQRDERCSRSRLRPRRQCGRCRVDRPAQPRRRPGRRRVRRSHGRHDRAPQG